LSREVRELIFRMVAENPTWGAPRIHGELLKLGFDVSERTVSRWIQRKDPDPARRWLVFLRNHRGAIAAMDFFTVSRPQLDAMMRQAKTRKLDLIAVWKLDRFGRSLRHLVDALAELEATSVAFVSLRDNLDLSTPAGKLMFHVIGAMAEFERALIQERVRAGLAVARSKGKTLGRPKIKREHDRDAKRIRQLRDEGQSYREIAEELGRSAMDVHRVAMTLGCSGAER
jgi:DNA invertase Pin-like site-specific DNA recombinase